jgi:hypothetical protein
MPRLPNITLPNIPLPITTVPRRRPIPPLTPAPSRSARAKLKREIGAVQKKIELAARSFYEVGVQLNTWKKTQSWRALSSASARGDFRAFVVTQVSMPYSTASRLMTVADAYPKSVATKLGIEKGFQLARYARLADAQALTLVRRDAELGSPPTPISKLSASDIEWLVTSLRMSEARAAAPKATREDKRVAKVFARRITAELGVDLDARIDKKRNKLCLELDLDLARGAI